MKNAIIVSGATLMVALLAVPLAALAETEGGEAALANALKQAKLSLEQGIAASTQEGVPISAKYEAEDDDADELQLSVYTMKGGSSDVDFETGDVRPREASFTEVIVDYATGKIGKVMPIEDGGDLAAARNQSKAMAQSKRSLESATAQAVSANSGYRAVSVIPGLKDGRPVAKVTLLKGSDWKTVYEALD